MIAEKEHRINGDINIPKIRLIDADGENKGVVSTRDALAMAYEAELDLVEIVPNAKPPVCRIMDYGKFRFDESKKASVARKKQKQVQVKEIKLRPGTDDGDYQIKLRKLMEFLEEGDKTKVTLRFRGREMAHRDIGMQVLKRIEADLVEYGVVEQFPKLEGRQMVMVLAPKKKSQGGGASNQSNASNAPAATTNPT
ncbi:MAG: translation initiation factor IF-3 [Thiofilum sp.]|uniref:translation initiation factor IF-3 n=1 Tax=Thiofilum sp. TaxID=2212733 RepID=UPI0025FCE4D9|nr:translation initiation factor IF-3 [Thiofilum sp.]MBK8454839.1 translation initiation factor IF-3 [Thiofilum sp.]